MEDTPKDEEDILTPQSDSDTDETENTGEDVETLKAQLAKANELANNQKIRAEKAESKLKSAPAEKIETSKQPILSAFDLMAVAKADITEEDLAEVMDYAKYKKISVSEALKSTVVKASLAEKAENRKAAEATATTGGRRQSGKVSDTSLVDKARGGEMPESDEDIKRLFLARRKGN